MPQKFHIRDAGRLHKTRKLALGATGGLNLVLDSKGQAYSWGAGPLGDGNGSNTSNFKEWPALLDGSFSFATVASGATTGAALDFSGNLWAWGGNLPTPTLSPVSPIQAFTSDTYIHVACGGSHGVLIRSDGTCWTWGADAGRFFGGALGDEGQHGPSTTSPVSVHGNHTFIQVSANQANNLALKADGSAWFWGQTLSGEIGNNTNTSVSSPVSVVGGHSFIQVSIGRCSLGLKADGSIWGWGIAELNGDGTNTNRSSPVLVAGSGSPNSYVFVSAGGSPDADWPANVAIRGDGTAWGWGVGLKGAIGDGTVNDSLTPVQVQGKRSFVAVASRANSNMGMMEDGSIWFWGLNSSDTGGYIDFRRPTCRAQLHSFIQVANGNQFSVGLKADGTCWAWGDNSARQLGDGTSTPYRSSPTSVAGANSFSMVSSNGFSTLALKSDGSVWGWGQNSQQQIPDGGAATFRSFPVSIVGGNSFVEIAMGHYHGLGLKSDGSVWAWGDNSFGELGDQTTVNKSTPVSVVGNHSFIHVYGGFDISVALKSDGSAWAWGNNARFALGDGTTLSKSSPVSVLGGHSFIKVYVGGAGCLGLKADGTTWGWGFAVPLGNNGGVDNNDRSSPEIMYGVRQFHSFSQLAAGTSFSLGLKADGTCWAWGANNIGQLGIGSHVDKYSPVSVLGGHLFRSVATGGGAASIGLKSDGTAWCWGENPQGGLGDNTQTDRSSPVSVVGGFSFVWVTASEPAAGALKADGSAWMWGGGSTLGNGTGIAVSSPVSVSGGHSFVQMIVNDGTVIALRGDGTAWCWGANNRGQIGDQTGSDRLTPSSVVGDHSFVQVYEGNTFSVALKADGSVWAWGLNSSGQLGDQTTTNRSSPVSVVGNHSFLSIVASNGGCRGIKSDGSVWCWGSGTLIGDGTTTPKSSPVRVAKYLTEGISFTSIFGGDNAANALRSDGSVWAWGSNASGGLGTMKVGDSSYPEAAYTTFGYRSFVDIGGSNQTFLMLENGNIWSTGDNAQAQLGERYYPEVALSGGEVTRVSMVQVYGQLSFTAIADGSSNGRRSLALRRDGRAYTWGDQPEQSGNGAAPILGPAPVLRTFY